MLLCFEFVNWVVSIVSIEIALDEEMSFYLMLRTLESLSMTLSNSYISFLRRSNSSLTISYCLWNLIVSCYNCFLIAFLFERRRIFFYYMLSPQYEDFSADETLENGEILPLGERSWLEEFDLLLLQWLFRGWRNCWLILWSKSEKEGLKQF